MRAVDPFPIDVHGEVVGVDDYREGGQVLHVRIPQSASYGGIAVPERTIQVHAHEYGIVVPPDAPAPPEEGEEPPTDPEPIPTPTPITG